LQGILVEQGAMCPAVPARHCGGFAAVSVSPEYSRFLRGIRRIFTAFRSLRHERQRTSPKIAPASPDNTAQTPIFERIGPETGAYPPEGWVARVVVVNSS
jgi:hypothetical protein